MRPNLILIAVALAVLAALVFARRELLRSMAEPAPAAEAAGATPSM